MRIITPILLSLLFLLTSCYTISEGSRNGIPQRVAKTGLICKTDEVRMSLGITANGIGTVSSEDFDFTVEDPLVVEQIQQYQNNNQPIKVFYKKELITFCRSSSKNYFVWKVEPLVLNKGGGQ